MSPQEKLAISLERLKALQDAGQRVVQSSMLSRTHRERLVRSGYLQEIIKGWYLPTQPEGGRAASGSTLAWFAGMRDFIVGYCNARFSGAWHLNPELSLRLATGERTLPRQLQVWTSAGNNQQVPLPLGYSLFIYRAPKLLSSRPDADNAGLRLADMDEALISVAPSFFALQADTAKIALGMSAESSVLLQHLLAGNHSVIAGRLAGAFRALGRADVAERILATFRSVGHVVQAVSPFEFAQEPLAGLSTQSPYVARMRLMWVNMRASAIAAFPEPSNLSVDVDQVLKQIETAYVKDAYHSLSIEGYRVTEGLIERVRRGAWQGDGEDQTQRDAMAAKGYHEAHQRVSGLIGRLLAHAEPSILSRHLHSAVSSWYLALFSPSVQAGLIQAADLAGWRNTQVLIRGALHVPPPPGAVRDCMPVLFELIAQELHPAARAVLGHFFFVFIHPYLDGNGRLARFLMNTLLVLGGYPWVVIPVQQRTEYMHALERASSYADIAPFANFVARLLPQGAKVP